ncbi:MAG: PadR family transcriptional regulator [Actinomycetota bacterium]|nr:PadR family transcriptional regulator [Actinomycetota bacterium]
MRSDLLRGHLDLLVLSVVEGGATHGYAIAEELRSRSSGEFELREGTLYPALYRLEGAGLLASEWREAGGRRRRVYRLTRAGRRALAGRRSEWTAFSRAVSRVIGATP